ncbi:MAG: endopeptidase La, partial [Alphaproteobacteria bacterium]
KAEKRIQNRIRNQVEQNQREYYLTEQLKAIQKELGESDEARDELRELEERIEKTKLSKEAKERAKSELKKLKNMNPIAAEATVVRNYLDWLLSIPWDSRTKVRKNLSKAEAILNEDHYGLEKVKERILEFLAVQTRVDKVKGPILCLVGPPGVGKTSLGKSIAKATGRQFVRISVGGLRDESEIRGHRRTYIGSMPGKIVQGMRKAKSSNPLFLLDEIDKMGSDWRGDPSSALLEVLDPEQNTAFSDHYLEVDYDLSDVLFVTTANSLNMPLPLLDRMEIIRISGYTEDEKVAIAQRHLVPKQRELHGLKEDEFSISEEGLRILIRKYCRESGVRNLEREIASLSRKAVKSIVLKKVDHLKLTKTNLEKYAGIPRYRFEEADLIDLLGITTGLAWTEVGGELLSIEAVMLPGKGKIMTTGKLGEVMQESIQAASSFVRSRAAAYGIKPTLFEKKDIHVHVPEGATPKDGPSAGVAMCTSIVSVLTGIPVKGNVAMTGEISLRGRVLPIGGLKEKLLAAHRGGIKEVLIPEENLKDLEEIPENVKKGLQIIPVAKVDEVLEHALVRKFTPIEWIDENLGDHLVANVSPGGGSSAIEPSPTTH